MTRTSRVAITLAMLLSFLVAACGSSAAPITPGASDGADEASVPQVGLPSGEALPGLATTWQDVTLADGVGTIEAAVVKAGLRSVESGEASSTLHFAADTPGIGDLRLGQVVAFETIGIGKVTDVREADGEIVVAADAAGLDEYVRDGVVGWTFPVDFMNLPVEAYAQSAAIEGLQLASVGDLPAGVADELAALGKAMTFKGKIKGFEVTYTLIPKPDQLMFSISAKRSNVSIGAKGFITTFQHAAQVVYENGEAVDFVESTEGLKGEAELTWSAFQVGNEDFDKTVVGYELPMSVPIPFAVGPVPMTLSLKGAVRIVPVFEHTTSGSSGGSFKLTYDSDHGFASHAGSIDPVAKVKSFAADLGSTETVTAGMGPTGFALGVEFPRLELALGHPVAKGLFQTYVFVTLNQYSNGQFTPGTTLTSDIPPCQRASIRVSAIAGYKFAVLGMAQLSDNTVLWEKTVDKFLHGEPCTLNGL